MSLPATKTVPSPYYSITSFLGIGIFAIAYSLMTQLWLTIIGKRVERQLEMTTNIDSSDQPKIAIVTGSNTGIGYETARSLAVEHGFTVILACRSRDKADKAVAQIQSEGGKALFLHPLDLSSFASVREFCQHIKSEFQHVHVLVNNAGRTTSGKSEKELDLMFQSNFLGHYLLTAELMPILLKSSARIINLSSLMHHFCAGQDLTSVQTWKRTSFADTTENAYCLSKLASILFTGAINQQYGGSSGVKSIAVSPGAVNSDLWRDYPKIMERIHEILYLTNREGCQTSVAAAVLPKITTNNNGDSTNKDCYPYLQPYWQPFGSTSASTSPIFPSFEFLGPYRGYEWTTPRLPVDHTKASQALWQASQEITGAQWPKAS